MIIFFLAVYAFAAGFRADGHFEHASCYAHAHFPLLGKHFRLSCVIGTVNGRIARVRSVNKARFAAITAPIAGRRCLADISIFATVNTTASTLRQISRAMKPFTILAWRWLIYRTDVFIGRDFIHGAAHAVMPATPKIKGYS